MFIILPNQCWSHSYLHQRARSNIQFLDAHNWLVQMMMNGNFESWKKLFIQWPYLKFYLQMPWGGKNSQKFQCPKGLINHSSYQPQLLSEYICGAQMSFPCNANVPGQDQTQSEALLCYRFHSLFRNVAWSPLKNQVLFYCHRMLWESYVLQQNNGM